MRSLFCTLHKKVIVKLFHIAPVRGEVVILGVRSTQCGIGAFCPVRPILCLCGIRKAFVDFPEVRPVRSATLLGEGAVYVDIRECRII